VAELKIDPCDLLDFLQETCATVGYSVNREFERMCEDTVVACLKTLCVSLFCVNEKKTIIDLRRDSALSGRDLNPVLSEIGAKILPTQPYILVNFKFRFLVAFDSVTNGVIRFSGVPTTKHNTNFFNSETVLVSNPSESLFVLLCDF
jgi:hypothetical protein